MRRILAAVTLVISACAGQGGGQNGSGGGGTGGAGAPGSGGAAAGTGGAAGGTATGGSTVNGSGGAASGGSSSGGANGSGGNGAGGTPSGGGGGALGGQGGSSTGGRGGTSPIGGNTAGGGNGSGPAVDRTNPMLYQLQFTAKEADAQAKMATGKEHAYLDTRVAPKGKLVVFLHGADDFADCGNGALATLVAGWGYHWFGPCYQANYGVENCGNDIEGCRMEAFEGMDHTTVLNITRPDSIEERIVLGLKRLQTVNPQGDWQYFLDGNAPRWSQIIISGHSHGASTAGVIGVHRAVDRVVMMAGPNDPGQGWLSSTPLTARDRFYGFSHTGDSQHSNHLAAWTALKLSGTATKVDGAQPPYGGSHRLFSGASVSDAHQSVAAGNISGFVDAWRYLYETGN